MAAATAAGGGGRKHAGGGEGAVDVGMNSGAAGHSVVGRQVGAASARPGAGGALPPRVRAIQRRSSAERQ